MTFTGLKRPQVRIKGFNASSGIKRTKKQIERINREQWWFCETVFNSEGSLAYVVIRTSKHGVETVFTEECESLEFIYIDIPDGEVS